MRPQEIVAASLGAWLVASAGCDVEPTDNTTAAAAAVTIGAGTGGGGSGGEGGNTGCTREAAEDLTGTETSVTITDIQAWSIPHQACIVIDAGDAVVWQSVTTTHPLVGGESPDVDATSPITEGATTGEVTITFPDAGEFPYFCEAHFTQMVGVVYVE